MGTGRALATLLPLCAWLAAAPLAAETYKWVDETGKTHFSDTPPPDRKADRITVKPQMPEDAAAAAKSRDWQTQLQESGVRRYREQQQAERDARDHRVAASKCTTAGRELDLYRNRRRLVRTGPDGQKQFVDDKERAAAVEAAQGKVDKFCR